MKTLWLLTWRGMKKRKAGTLLLGGACCGVLMFTGSYIQQTGIAYTTAGKAGFLTAIYVVLVPVLGIFLKKKPRPILWVSVALACVGLYFLCFTDKTFSLAMGDAAMLGGAVMFALHIMVVDHFSPLVDGVCLSFVQFLTAGSLGMVVAFITEQPSFAALMREVLPGRAYTIPATQEDKYNPLTVDSKQFVDIISAKPLTVSKAIYSSFSGISPLVANELAHRAGLDADSPVAAYSHDELLHLGSNFTWMMEDIKNNRFTPNIVRDGNEPKEFSSIELTQYSDLTVTKYESISEVLELYYSERNTYTRIRQKSADLRKHVNPLLERNQKKYSLQMKQLKDSEKREKYKVYGELINAFGYGLTPDDKFLEAANYYDDNKIIKIPIDSTKTPAENAQKYFDKYGKMKRTAEALNELILETKGQIDHLESIQNSLDIALSADDLVQIKDELIEYGFIKKGKGSKKQKVKSKPFHYISSDGFDMYVGKNNYQNDELTFKLATGNDWWFHAKGMPGSHVVVKSRGDELPDSTFEDAARLAAHYSRGRGQEKVEIDYTEKKNVKKPGGGKPGFVVYYTNYSMMIDSDISALKQIE